MQIRVVPLGAGQDVGRSCVLVSFGGKTIMFDCGMHMGYNDERRYPDFSYISRGGNFTEAIDAVIITHFHLDHCGALPVFTEVNGYNGPVYMTYPTRAILPLMLEDYRKVMVERLGQGEAFSSQNVRDCMAKVIAVDLHETVQVDGELSIRAFYAGHVLGAAMFHVTVGGESVVYTGDYNMTPDRHLGAASIERVRPDLLITESTYATTIRDSKQSRERDFLMQVQEVVEAGGKVLIPVFALGRAQELLILLDEYWDRLNIQAPIYFTAGMTAKANLYYKLFISWTSQKVKDSFVDKNPFDFRHVSQWDRSLIDAPGPCVLFATPGMLHAGQSLEVFKRWAPSEKNMVILPGYCVSGTVGSKLMAGKTHNLQVDARTIIDVKCRVRYLSFSAHADAKGILQLVQQCQPKHVMLVHGEKSKMEFLKAKITRSFGLACFMPPNGTAITVQTGCALPVEVSDELVRRHWGALRAGCPPALGDGKEGKEGGGEERAAAAAAAARRAEWEPESIPRMVVEGVLLMREEGAAGDAGGGEGAGGPGPAVELVDTSEVAGRIGVAEHRLSLGCRAELHAPGGVGGKRRERDGASPGDVLLEMVEDEILQWMGGVKVERGEGWLSARSFHVRVGPAVAGGKVVAECSWQVEDAPMGERCLGMLHRAAHGFNA